MVTVRDPILPRPMSQKVMLPSFAFNTDLLIGPEDRKTAERCFPGIFTVLDHSDLRVEFMKYERRANLARVVVGWLGLSTVIAATLALLSIITEPLLPKTHSIRVAALLMEFGGLVAAILGASGLWLGRWRDRWLRNRFISERIRQWHFQFLVHRGESIECLYSKNRRHKRKAFLTKRKEAFDQFMYQYQTRAETELTSLTDGLFAAPLHPVYNVPGYKMSSGVLDKIFAAYYELRFMHQLHFATHKLSSGAEARFWQFLRWRLRRQERCLRLGINMAVVWVLMCSASLILFSLLSVPHAIHTWVACMAIVAAIIGVALKTTLEGLGISQDIRRYRKYQRRIDAILRSFVKTSVQTDKWRHLVEMEALCEEELKEFICAHRESNFSL